MLYGVTEISCVVFKVYVNEQHAVLLLQVHPKASLYIINKQSAAEFYQVEIKSWFCPTLRLYLKV